MVERSVHGGAWGLSWWVKTTGGDAAGEARWVERSARMQERLAGQCRWPQGMSWGWEWER